MSVQDTIASAITKCPFLHELSVQHGNHYARNIATQPTKPAGSSAPRPLLEELDMFHTTFKLFHGMNGIIPLAKAQGQNFEAPRATSNLASGTSPSACAPERAAGRMPPMFASITMSMGATPDPGRDRHSRKQPNKDGNKRDRFKPSSAQASGSLGAAPGCPLRKWLGPLSPYVFNAQGHIQCPEAIVSMRATLAKTEPVRRLRPKGLPVKLIAVGATAAAVNVPCGAVREHFDKFSLGWFIAVHASIPFVAMLRKAVIMPKLAIVITIAAAVAGQVLGSRLERRRIVRVKRAAAAGPALVSSDRQAATAPAACPQKDDLFAAMRSLRSLVPEPHLGSPAFLARIPSRLRVS